MKIIDKIKELGRLDSYFNKTNRNTYDSYASILLHRLFPAHTILPFTPFSLNPDTILHIINEIQINKRSSIIEFGTGISTLVLAKYIKDNQLNTSLISIEENEDWANYINEQLRKYDCESKAEVHFVPLKGYTTSNYEGKWYDVYQLKNIISHKKFDLIVVDGPGTGSDHLIRYPAIIELSDYLMNDFIIFLDDIRRKGERELFGKWIVYLTKLGLRITEEMDESKVYATIKCGNAFSTNTMSY